MSPCFTIRCQQSKDTVTEDCPLIFKAFEGKKFLNAENNVTTEKMSVVEKNICEQVIFCFIPTDSFKQTNKEIISFCLTTLYMNVLQ